MSGVSPTRGLALARAQRADSHPRKRSQPDGTDCISYDGCMYSTKASKYSRTDAGVFDHVERESKWLPRQSSMSTSASTSQSLDSPPDFRALHAGSSRCRVREEVLVGEWTADDFGIRVMGCCVSWLDPSVSVQGTYERYMHCGRIIHDIRRRRGDFTAMCCTREGGLSH